MAPYVDAAKLKEMISDGRELALLDVREAGQFGLGHLLFTVPAPYSRLELIIGGLVPRKSVRMVLVDGGDGIAEKSARRLESLGYGDISVLQGGVGAWEAAGNVLFKGVNVPCKAFGEAVEHGCDTPSIPPEELKALMDAGEDFVVLDSRPLAEYQKMNIPTATDCPGAELVYRLGDLAPSPDTLVVVNCAGRTRSIIGAQSLINAGVPNRVVALRNGTMGWRLAGFELGHGNTQSYPRISDDALTAAQDLAADVAQRFGVKSIDRETLESWRGDEDRTLYVLDVRSPGEYAARHLPGSHSAPGGQLVQGTDAWMGVRGARVVLVDDTEVRAIMTAHWLVQMGWDVQVLKGGIGGGALDEGNAPSAAVLPPEIPSQETITPAQLSEDMKQDKAAVLDVGFSTDYRNAHIPGARWSNRAVLQAAVAEAPAGRRVVFTSMGGAAARLAALDAREISDRPVAVLDGGNRAWAEAGLPMEQPVDQAPAPDHIDHLMWVHDRHQGVEESMKGYLDWETELPRQIEQDGDARFSIGPVQG